MDKQGPPMESQHVIWLKYAGVAERAGCSVPHVEKAAYSDQLKSYGTGRNRRFTAADVDDWIKRGMPTKAITVAVAS